MQFVASLTYKEKARQDERCVAKAPLDIVTFSQIF